MTNFIWEMMYFSTMTNLEELKDCMLRWMEATVITGFKLNITCDYRKGSKFW